MLLVYCVKERNVTNAVVQPTNHCSNCGAVLPAGAPAGLCPTCLLDQGAETVTADRPVGHRFEPPSQAEIARLFPQLEILGLLGAGGMGAVYKARQPTLDRLVALKILPLHGAGGVSFAERFNREARALARLSHPNIVTVHEFGQAGGMYFFIMEFVDGANLRQLEKSARLSPREALQIIPQICDALQYAHDEGVVHRDIKPENVLVDRKGRVKIADFGLAKMLDPGVESLRLTVEGQVMGTPHYMAPEQVERPLAVDHRADIYSLGVVFYEMLTGELPLGKFSPPSRKVQVDVRLDEIVLRALENDPERRYQQASEVKQRVQTVLETPAPAAATSAEAGESKQPGKPGVRYLRWAGIPVVVERDGERELNAEGALGAVFLTMTVAAVAHYLVRWLAGTEHAWTRVIWFAGLLTAFWGIRRTLKSPWDEPRRAEDGTVIPLPRAGTLYLRDYLMLVGLFVFVVASHYFKTWVFPAAARLPNHPAALQQAEFNRHSETLSATLPGGGTVELLALGEADSAPDGWWRHDGAPATNLPLEVETFVLPAKPQTQLKHLILILKNLPEGASGPMAEFEPLAAFTSGGKVLLDGRPLPGAWPFRVAFPENTGSANLRVGLGLEPWRTIATQNADGYRGTQQRRPNDPPWTVNFSNDPAESRGQAQLSYVFGEELKDWSHRLVAVDTNGVEHAAQRVGATPSGKLTLYTVSFLNLPLRAVMEFRLQVRPVHWIEFRDLALQPRTPLPRLGPYTFGPVVERTFEELIDFDNGRIAGFPPGKPGTHPFEGIGEDVLWAQEQGFDAVAGLGELRVLNVVCAPLQNSDWDTLAPDELQQRLYQGQYAPKVLKPAEPAGLPATFAFRTREGGIGMLQLVAFNEQRPGVTVRIKRLVRPGGRLAAVRAQHDSRTGELVAWLSEGGSVALVAIRSAETNADAWWRADGDAAPGLNCTVEYPQPLSAVAAQRFDMLFQVHDVPNPAESPVFEFPRAIRSAAGGRVSVRGVADKSLLPVQVVWPEGEKSASARVGIPRAGWHTIRSFEPVSRSFTKTRLGEDPNWEIENAHRRRRHAGRASHGGLRTSVSALESARLRRALPRSPCSGPGGRPVQ